MTRIVFGLVFLCAFAAHVGAQSTAFIFKGGGSIAVQKWDNSITRQPLFTYHADIGMESINNDNDNGSLYAMLGYHVRGSAIRFRYININNPLVPGSQFTQKIEFKNIALQVGAKQKFPLSERTRYYYFGGLRGEYHLKSNLAELNELSVCNRGSLPLSGGEQKWLLGLTVGGGLQIDFAELVGAQIEVSIHPDITTQYRQGPITNVIDQCYPGTTYTIPERRIRNTTVEVSVGLRLLRKVIYVD